MIYNDNTNDMYKDDFKMEKILRSVETGGEKAKLIKKASRNTCILLNKYVDTCIIGVRIFTVNF